MKTRLAFFALTALVLNACSYDHGIRRILDLQHEVSDFSCITQNLMSLGYTTEDVPHGVNYYNETAEIFASLTYLPNNTPGPLRYNRKKMEHLAGLPSPSKCEAADILSLKIKEIETRVFKACNIKVIDAKQDQSCHG